MFVHFQASVLGFASGDVVELPDDHPGLKDAIKGEYATKLSKTAAAKLLEGADPLSVDESAAEGSDASNDAQGASTS